MYYMLYESKTGTNCTEFIKYLNIKLEICLSTANNIKMCIRAFSVWFIKRSSTICNKLTFKLILHGKLMK